MHCMNNLIATLWPVVAKFCQLVSSTLSKYHNSIPRKKRLVARKKVKVKREEIGLGKNVHLDYLVC